MQAKVHGQFAKANIPAERKELMGNCFSSTLTDVPEKTTYSTPNSPGYTGEGQSSYHDRRRLSID